jgi:hypothetical protein
MAEEHTIPNLNGLRELAERHGVDIQPTLLRVMTDLYIQMPKHSIEEEQQFTELALRLFDLVDPATRAIVAKKIANYPSAPQAVRQRVLRDQDWLVSAGHATDVSADPFGGRAATAEELSELFLAASADERRIILLNLPYAALSPAKAIPASIARESINRLETAALAHNSEGFARELARVLAIAPDQARRLINDESGEPIVVAAAALGMPAAVLQRILLCLNPAISQSVQRVYELALLHEEIDPAAALRLIAIWQATHKGDTRLAASQSAPRQPMRLSSERRERAEPAARPRIRSDEHRPRRKSDSA